MEVLKSLIGTKKETNATDGLCNSIKAAVEILNNTNRVEVGSPFWVNTTEVLENETNQMLRLTMPKVA